MSLHSVNLYKSLILCINVKITENEMLVFLFLLFIKFNTKYDSGSLKVFCIICSSSLTLLKGQISKIQFG